MKFFQIATASFLAGNAVVAAYEIPSDNLIAELADEYNAELSNFLDFDEAKCMSEGEGIEQCISGKLAEDAEWASSMEKAVMTAEPCLVDAMAKGDAKKIVKCALPVLDITDKYCSTAAFREACGMAPSMIEDFVLNLVEVLEVAAVWEDKFIAKTNLKERLSNFFDEAKCMSEGDGIAQCVIDELGKDAEWTSSVEQAVATAEPCFVKAAAEGDIAKVFDCVRLVWDVADKYCSTESARKACDPSSSSSSDGYGLRGSSSFNEEAEKDVDWVKVKCEAEQSKAKWRAEMEKRTGQAKLHAQKRYEEAKAAALRAEARFTPAAKEAWEKVKAAHDETWEGAKKWWDRHFGDVSDFEYGEDEFDVQC